MKNPTNDLVFKKFFTAEEHQDIVLHLIEDLTGTHFDDLEQLSSYDIFLQELEEALAADRPLDQRLTYTEVDFRVRDSQGQLATVEMQVAKQRFSSSGLFFTPPRLTFAITALKNG